MSQMVTFSCPCGRHVACERGSTADRERRCSRCRVPIVDLTLVRTPVTRTTSR